MSNSIQAKIGAVLFFLWGVMHVAGGGVILFSLAKGAASGYSIYGETTQSFPEISGAVLGYLAYTFIWIGAMVSVVAVVSNWNNSPNGLALNTFLVGLTDAGLVWFLVFPGFVSWGEASAGLVLYAAAVVISGNACRSAH